MTTISVFLSANPVRQMRMTIWQPRKLMPITVNSTQYSITRRVSGGVRYEDFKQVSLATSSLIFSEQDLNNYFNPERVLESTIAEDDLYTALSLTYMASDNYQLRFGYGETVVRPDLRETVPVAYYDQLRTFVRSEELA